jgi:hypothetical protein
MGQSKIPIFAYVDESGNTGRNIFDQAQPDFYTAAFVNRGDFDSFWGERIKAIARKVGADAVHATLIPYMLAALWAAGSTVIPLAAGATGQRSSRDHYPDRFVFGRSVLLDYNASHALGPSHHTQTNIRY